jgi:hypothetical protein
MPSQLTWIFTRISPTNLHEPNSPSRKKWPNPLTPSKNSPNGSQLLIQIDETFHGDGLWSPVPKLQKWVKRWFPLLRVWHPTCLDVCLSMAEFSGATFWPSLVG